MLLIGSYMQAAAYLQLFLYKLHNVTGNKYKLAHTVQETAANDHSLDNAKVRF